MRKSKTGGADRLWVKVKWLNREDVVAASSNIDLPYGRLAGARLTLSPRLTISAVDPLGTLMATSAQFASLQMPGDNSVRAPMND